MANRAAPGGPHEELLTADQCSVLSGFRHAGRSDATAGGRFECALPAGGTISGLVGAGSCE